MYIHIILKQNKIILLKKNDLINFLLMIKIILNNFILKLFIHLIILFNLKLYKKYSFHQKNNLLTLLIFYYPFHLLINTIT